MGDAIHIPGLSLLSARGSEQGEGVSRRSGESGQSRTLRGSTQQNGGADAAAVSPRSKHVKVVNKQVALVQGQVSKSYYDAIPFGPGVELFALLGPEAGPTHEDLPLRSKETSSSDEGLPRDRYDGYLYVPIAETAVFDEGKDHLLCFNPVRGRVESRVLDQHSGSHLSKRWKAGSAAIQGADMDHFCAVHKVPHWQSPWSNRSQLVLKSTLDTWFKEHPRTCALQQFVKCRGAKASVYRIMWRRRKPYQCINIISVLSFLEAILGREEEEAKTPEQEPRGSISVTNKRGSLARIPSKLGALFSDSNTATASVTAGEDSEDEGKRHMGEGGAGADADSNVDGNKNNGGCLNVKRLEQERVARMLQTEKALSADCCPSTEEPDKLNIFRIVSTESAIEESMARIVRHLERRLKLRYGLSKLSFETLTCDFIKSENGQFVLTNIKSFELSEKAYAEAAQVATDLRQWREENQGCYDSDDEAAFFKARQETQVLERKADRQEAAARLRGRVSAVHKKCCLCNRIFELKRDPKAGKGPEAVDVAALDSTESLFAGGGPGATSPRSKKAKKQELEEQGKLLFEEKRRNLESALEAIRARSDLVNSKKSRSRVEKAVEREFANIRYESDPKSTPPQAFEITELMARAFRTQLTLRGQHVSAYAAKDRKDIQDDLLRHRGGNASDMFHVCQLCFKVWNANQRCLQAGKQLGSTLLPSSQSPESGTWPSKTAVVHLPGEPGYGVKSGSILSTGVLFAHNAESTYNEAPVLANKQLKAGPKQTSTSRMSFSVSATRSEARRASRVLPLSSMANEKASNMDKKLTTVLASSAASQDVIRGQKEAGKDCERRQFRVVFFFQELVQVRKHLLQNRLPHQPTQNQAPCLTVKYHFQPFVEHAGGLDEGSKSPKGGKMSDSQWNIVQSKGHLQPSSPDTPEEGSVHVRQARVHYVLANREGFQWFLMNKRIPLEAVLPGDKHGPYKGVMFLTRFLTSFSGHFQQSMINFTVDLQNRLGESVTLRASVGLIADHVQAAQLDPMLPLYRQGEVLYFPSNFFDLRPLPSIWLEALITSRESDHGAEAINQKKHALNSTKSDGGSEVRPAREDRSLENQGCQSSEPKSPNRSFRRVALSRRCSISEILDSSSGSCGSNSDAGLLSISDEAFHGLVDTFYDLVSKKEKGQVTRAALVRMAIALARESPRNSGSGTFGEEEDDASSGQSDSEEESTKLPSRLDRALSHFADVDDEARIRDSLSKISWESMVLLLHKESGTQHKTGDRASNSRATMVGDKAKRVQVLEVEMRNEAHLSQSNHDVISRQALHDQLSYRLQGLTRQSETLDHLPAGGAPGETQDAGGERSPTRNAQVENSLVFRFATFCNQLRKQATLRRYLRFKAYSCIWNLIDVDKSGAIDVAELRSYMRQNQQSWAQLGANQKPFADWSVSEMHQYVCHWLGTSDRAKTRFERYDKDGIGSIAWSEFVFMADQAFAIVARDEMSFALCEALTSCAEHGVTSAFALDLACFKCEVSRHNPSNKKDMGKIPDFFFFEEIGPLQTAAGRMLTRLSSYDSHQGAAAAAPREHAHKQKRLTRHEELSLLKRFVEDDITVCGDYSQDLSDDSESDLSEFSSSPVGPGLSPALGIKSLTSFTIPENASDDDSDNAASFEAKEEAGQEDLLPKEEENSHEGDNKEEKEEEEEGVKQEQPSNFDSALVVEQDEMGAENTTAKVGKKKAKKKSRKKVGKLGLIKGARRLKPLRIASIAKKKRVKSPASKRRPAKRPARNGDAVPAYSAPWSPQSLTFSPDSSPRGSPVEQELERTIACLDSQREALSFLGGMTSTIADARASKASETLQDDRVEEHHVPSKTGQVEAKARAAASLTPGKVKGQRTKGLKLAQRFKQPSREVKAVVKKISKHKQASYQEELNYILTAEMESLFVFAKHGNVRQARLLLDRTKLDPNFIYKGLSMLHVAASHGQEEMTRFLLSRQANPGLADHNGYVPADLARKEEYYNIAGVISDFLEEQEKKKVQGVKKKMAIKKKKTKKKTTTNTTGTTKKKKTTPTI